jgi:DNA polymerase-1
MLPAMSPGSPRRKVLVLDGHSLAYRAFFALPDTLVTSSGQITNAVYGFTSMLIKLMADEKPDGVVVAFDRGKPVFRVERYVEYKANRRETPDTFSQQLPLIRDVLGAMRIPIIELEGFEADDILATLAKQAGDEKDELIIVSGDRDVLQLVRDCVSVMMTRRGISDIVRYDAAGVKEKYGVTPEQWTDYVALKGETSDNLPGVPGIGDKTAAKLIQNYGDIEGVIAHAGELTPKIRAGVSEMAEQIRINKELGYLLEDVELPMNLDDIVLREWDDDEVRALFTSLEFKTLYDRLKEYGLEPQTVAAPAAAVTVERFAKGAEPAGTTGVAWDSEWIAFAATEQRATAIPLDDAFDALGGWLADPLRRKDIHDAKPLTRLALEEGAEVDGIGIDTMLAAYLLEPGMPASYSLHDVAQRYLGVTLEEDAPAKGKGKQAALDLGSDDGRRAGREAAITLQLGPALESKLEAHGMLTLARNLEFPLIGVLARMEHAGILVDRTYLEELGDGLGSRMRELETKIHELAGEPFNVNSNLQLQVVLFEQLGLTKTKKIKTGWSTDQAELQKIRDEHPIIETLIDYREVNKLKTGFTDALLPLINPRTGRIHTTYLQNSAATGRLASTNPNMQNIPIRGELGRQIRRAFIAPEGHVLVSADYSQIELRVLAHLSGDEGILEAFASEHDFHAAIAAKVYGVDVADVQSRMRDYAKQFSYGIAYGMSAFGVSQRLGVDAEEAQAFIDAYYAQFPKVKTFLDAQVNEARKDGFTTTMFGRRRYLPELESGNYRVRTMGERMALNAPIQGTAADIIKRAMILMDARLRHDDARLLGDPSLARMLLSVHDELVFEVPEERVEQACALVREVMESAADLRCSLVAEPRTGKNWSDAHA